MRKKFWGLRKGTNLRGAAFSALKMWIAGAILLPMASAAGIVVTDQIRKRRVPGGFKGFPHLPPLPTQVRENQLTIYTDGKALYRDMLAAIDSATETVYLESFIWKGDEVGKRFKSAVIAAAERGVKVYLIFDTFANLVVNPRFKTFPKHANLQVLRFPIFRPDILLVRGRLFGRDHRKLLVVDGKIGWIGGYNLGSLYETEWRDTQLCIRGPATSELSASFIHFWNEFAPASKPRITEVVQHDWDSRVQAVENSPSALLFPIRGRYLEAIKRASKRIWITQAYFLPDREFIVALKDAAQRGVDVRVLIPKRSNHVLADWAAATNFTELLEAGVQIYRYQHAMVHAKTATIDGRWVTIGTANIDRLSMQGNFEINVILYGTQIAKAMEKVFLKDLTTAAKLEPEKWAQRSFLRRALSRSVARLRFWL